MGFEKCNLLLNFVINFDKFLKLRFVFVLILKLRMLLEKALKVLKIIYRESGSILLEFVLKIVEFFMEVKSAVTVFHHLLGLFPIFDFLFEGLLLISSERYLEDKFGSFVGIVMPILLKRVEVSEDKFDVFGGF